LRGWLGYPSLRFGVPVPKILQMPSPKRAQEKACESVPASSPQEPPFPEERTDFDAIARWLHLADEVLGKPRKKQA
jgi:hypothetical protein